MVPALRGGRGNMNMQFCIHFVQTSFTHTIHCSAARLASLLIFVTDHEFPYGKALHTTRGACSAVATDSL